MENNEKIAKEHQKRRREHKIKLAVISVILLVLAAGLIGSYFMLSKNEYNTYTENAKVNYKVNLKENEFYQETSLDERSSVVASLIENLEIDFNYDFNLSKEQDYTYDYKIVAVTNIKETKKSNSIYETTEELVNKEVQETNEKNLNISEKVTIDYNEYNEKMNKFVKAYGLNDTTSTLELDMYVNVVNKYDGTRVNKESKVMTLSIPLTTKTVDVSIGSNVIKDEGKMLYKKSEYKNMEYVLGAGILLAATGIVVLVMFVKYVIDTRSAEAMYEQDLKQILFNYKSYIQQSTNDIATKGYKKIQINTFNEILGLRDTMQTPILMYTEKDELKTKFVIIKDGILYIYILGAKEIREELRAKSAERKAREEQAKNKKQDKKTK